MVRPTARIGAALLAVSAATAGTAQSFNQAVLRYRAEQRQCAEAHRQQVAPICDAACRSAAESRHQRCLDASERRYRQVLRRVLRTRN
jgi:hypothetical protein